MVPQNSIKNIPTYLYLCSSIRYDYNYKNLYINSSPPSAACMCQTASIVSGNGLLPFQHQAISSVPEPCWLKINWTLRNNPVKFISPCYLIHLFITVHKIWIELELKENELNWNWIERFWIWFKIELELKNPESNLNWNWIERNELIRALILIESAPNFEFPTDVSVYHSIYPNGPEAGRGAEGPNSFHWKNVKLEVLSCCTKFHEPHVVSEYAYF